MKLTNHLLATAIAGLMAASSAFAGNITVKGSDTLVVVAQKWAETYMGKNAATKISVTGGGTGTGFSALQQNQTDLCNASRKIKAKEIEACVKVFGKRPIEYKVALDGLSVYVNAANKVESLGIDELEGIFTGKIRNWKELGGADAPIVVYSRENSSGTYEFFKENVLKGKDFVASAQTMPGTAAVIQGISKDPNAIGYAGAGGGSGAKHLKVSVAKGGEGVEPSEENVVSGKYPIWRHLFIYVDPARDKGEINSYLKWIRSDEGQKVVKAEGYYPLPANLRSK
jgi:phosphate transport system substrate-binding protein